MAVRHSNITNKICTLYCRRISRLLSTSYKATDLKLPSLHISSTYDSSTSSSQQQQQQQSSSSSPSSMIGGLGVLRENEIDDINLLVQNYTSPALARSLREKEMTLQQAARLCKLESFDELKALLLPYSKETIEKRRRKKHSIDLSESSAGLTKKELVILQRYLHRMPRHVSKAAGRRASVVIPLCNVNGIASILFEKRSDKVRTHKQQVCFPGGMVEEGVDATIIQTSLREMEEELGIVAENVEVLGILRCNWSEVADMTGIAVTPVVGYIGELSQLDLKPNPDEVEYLFTISFEDLLDESKWTYSEFTTPIFNGDSYVIWGLTAYLLNRFLKDVVLKCSITHSSNNQNNKINNNYNSSNSNSNSNSSDNNNNY